jgi:hypothetical protein
MKKNIKTLLILISIFAVCQNISYGQKLIHNITTTTKRLNQFLENTLIVVGGGQEKFDSHLKSAFQKYWTITKFEFIPIEELNTKIANKSNSFFVPVVGVYGEHDVWYKIDPKEKFRELDQLVLINGGEKSIKEYHEGISIAVEGINENFESNFLDMEMRLDYIVKSFNDLLILARDHELKEANEEFRQEKEKKVAVLKTKTLLIDENLTKIKNSLKSIPLDSELLKSYPYKYKIVSHEEAVQIINSDNKEYCYFFPSLSGAMHIEVYDVETKEPIYWGGTKVSRVIKEKQITELAEAIKNAK